MLNKFVDVLKEVFWLKKSTAKKPVRKAVVRKKTASRPKSVKVRNVGAGFKPAPTVKPAKPIKTKAPVADPDLVQAGRITHYFDRIKVCVVKITQGSILIGDRLTIKGAKTSFVQKIWSMQIENKDVKVARKGQLIGLKVDKPVAVGDIVYK